MFSFYSVTQWLVIHQLSEMISTDYHKTAYLGIVAHIPLVSILCLMVTVSMYFKAQEDPNLFFLADSKKSNYNHYL